VLRAARRLAVTLLGGVAVVVLVAAFTWLLLYAMRPNLFPSEPGALEQLGRFLERGFLHFDFDRGGQSGREVSRLVHEGVPVDAALFAGGMVAGVAMGVLGGLACAARPRGFVRRLAELLAAAAVSTPVYVVGLLALLLFGDNIADLADLGIPLEYDGVRTLLVPWLVLGLPLAGLIVRAMSGAAEQVLQEDYISAAESRGVPRRRLFLRHVTPPSLTPPLALASASANIMVMNMVLVESVFSVPGFLQELRSSVRDADVPVLLALTIVSAAFVVVTSITLQAIVDALDPRGRRA
jgi:peptide/nickel transport system permease protein